jgi:hypothetical protein
MVSGESSGVDVAGNLFGSSASNHDSVNPATGLPMVTGDSFGVDVGGNTFGTNDFSSGISNNSLATTSAIPLVNKFPNQKTCRQKKAPFAAPFSFSSI